MDDLMQVTGMRMTSVTAANLPGSASNDGNPNDSYGGANDSERQTHYAANSLLAPNIKASSSSALKAKHAYRGRSKGRKSSIGEDSSSAGTPINKMGIAGSALYSNHNDSYYRNGANASSQTNNSVVVVDQEINEPNSGLRLSSINIYQAQSNGQAQHMKIVTNGANNTTGDTIFQQAHSTNSNVGPRSNQTQSTAYSVRTTSSGRQPKGKLVSGGNGTTLQTSQSPFTDNTSGGRGARKRSMHASNGRPVYEQVDEIDESGSGKISLKLNEKQVMLDEPVGSDGVQSPHYAAKSAKVKRKAIPKTNIETNLPHSSEKMQGLSKNDPMTTPKIS